MNNSVKTVKTTANILFKNGQTYKIPFVNTNSSTRDLSNYATSCTVKEKLYESTSNNIIGNICSNILSLNLMSKNKMLISSNKDSMFYGYMNSTAKIVISVTGDDNVTTDLGTYYIDTWENGADSGTHAEVYITAGDLMSRIKNINIGKVRLKEHMNLSTYIISVINALNKNLPSDMQVKYILSELEELDTIYGSNWQMWYNNIDRNDIETIFNTIAQNTLSYIWIDRAGYLRIDCLLDDSTEVPVCDLSGSVNLFSYKVNNADIYNYSGVKTTFIDNVTYRDEQVLKLSEYSLIAGMNTITANLNTDKVINIHHIEVNGKQGEARCLSFYSFRDSIEMKVKAGVDTTADITVYGTIINESYDTYTKYNDEDNTGTLLEIENNVMYSKSNIVKYTDAFANLIAMTNAQVLADGYINPQVQLSDMIRVTGSKLDIDNNYKVACIELKLGTNYRCNISLMKTV